MLKKKKAESWSQTLISGCVSIFNGNSLLLIHFLKWISAKNAETLSWRACRVHPAGRLDLFKNTSWNSNSLIRPLIMNSFSFKRRSRKLPSGLVFDFGGTNLVSENSLLCCTDFFFLVKFVYIFRSVLTSTHLRLGPQVLCGNSASDPLFCFADCKSKKNSSSFLSPSEFFHDEENIKKYQQHIAWNGKVGNSTENIPL